MQVVVERVVEESFEGSPDELREWIRQIENKHPNHDLQWLKATFYTNWFNIVFYWIHEHLLDSREKIKNEIINQLGREKFDVDDVRVDVESEGLNRRYKVEIQARKRKVLYLGLGLIIRIATLLPRLIQIVLSAITAIIAGILALIGASLFIVLIRILVKILVWIREIIEEIPRAMDGLAYLAGIAILALGGYILYKEVRRRW